MSKLVRRFSKKLSKKNDSTNRPTTSGSNDQQSQKKIQCQQNSVETARQKGKLIKLTDDHNGATGKLSDAAKPHGSHYQNDDNVDGLKFKNATGQIKDHSETKEQLLSRHSYRGKDAIGSRKKTTPITDKTKASKSDKLISGNLEEEIRFHKKAKQIAMQDGKKVEECRANQAIGDILWNTGNFEKAKHYYQDALENALELGDRHYEGTSYLGLASVSSKDLEYEKARNLYEKALHIFEAENNDPILKEKVLVGLGIAWLNLGNIQKATEYIGRAEQLTNESDKDSATDGLTDQLKNSTTKLPSSQTPEFPESLYWTKTSIMHRKKLMKLREKIKYHPDQVHEVNGVRVCCSEEFLIGKGSDGTLVYVGLGNDGVEKAVKRLPRDACSSLAEQEKKVLNELSRKESQHFVNYWFLEEQNDKDFLFLILDLCEETLENFVEYSSVTDLVKCAPDIIRQVLKGLADLHRNPDPILHRDLKPSNILRNVQGNWLLADFGITRILKAGVRPYVTNSRKAEDWKAAESCYFEDMNSDRIIHYKKESDMQVAGMVAFYVLTKGGHPFGEKPDRLRNLLDGKPVGLDKLKDDAAKDLIAWMLSHEPKNRPLAEVALNHSYLQSSEQQFEMLCKGEQQHETNALGVDSGVIRTFKGSPKDSQNGMAPDVLRPPPKIPIDVNLNGNIGNASL